MQCDCPESKKCCAHVNCVDDGYSNFKIDPICQDVCPLFFTHIYEQFDCELKFIELFMI